MKKHKAKIFTGAVLVLLVLVVYFVVLRQKSKAREALIENILYTNDKDMIFGLNDAPLTIYLFSRYDCSFCRKFFTDVFPAFDSLYLQTNKVRLVVKLVNFSSDEHVARSLQTLACLNKIGNPEKMHQLLLNEPNVVYTPDFIRVIDELILKDDALAECVIGGESANYLLENKVAFKNLNLTGTPTFVINNRIYKGFKPEPVFLQIVEKELQRVLR